MKHQPLTWERIVSQLPTAADESRLLAPFGFATRVVAQWRAARRDESLRRWASWSLRTAMASVAACALLAFLQTWRAGSILLPLPEPPSLSPIESSP
jgi:hypothetical protein